MTPKQAAERVIASGIFEVIVQDMVALDRQLKAKPENQASLDFKQEFQRHLRLMGWLK